MTIEEVDRWIESYNKSVEKMKEEPSEANIMRALGYLKGIGIIAGMMLPVVETALMIAEEESWQVMEGTEDSIDLIVNVAIKFRDAELSTP